MCELEWREKGAPTSEEGSREEHGDHLAGFAEDLRGVVHVL